MKNFLIVLFNPSTWFMSSPYSKACDLFCIEALKNPIFTDINQYKCKLNNKIIWIGNRAFWFEFREESVRPSRATVLKIYAALDKERFKK